ncbi:hypothetical protein L596_015245 [Steinernema carpocapsae]|uniref:Uncharacterized protein n=1 Tax=Steinernema carpocapsae TaxID=34508 RepID=A0A4V6XW84_STECR|nr:hypothetical protein L596_015245 [Steinernema carpocapsae]
MGPENALIVELYVPCTKKRYNCRLEGVHENMDQMHELVQSLRQEIDNWDPKMSELKRKVARLEDPQEEDITEPLNSEDGVDRQSSFEELSLRFDEQADRFGMRLKRFERIFRSWKTREKTWNPRIQNLRFRMLLLLRKSRKHSMSKQSVLKPG